MRVVHVIDSLNRGGAEVMLTAMAPHFQARGVACDVVALLRRPSSLEQSLLDNNIRLQFTDVPKLYSLRQIPVLSKLLRGYDLIHVHLFPAQLWTVMAAARWRHCVPLVTTEHTAWKSRRRWWQKPVDQWMYQRYKRIACISDATAESLVQWCPGVADRVTLIPNGIPLGAFENASPADLDGVPKNAVRLVFVARFYAPKDHATLLRALPAVPDAHLILVGDGPFRTRLEQMAQSLGIRNRVTFLGEREDVAAVLKASDIYIHSTYSEGFGIAACEAMAAGLPVVASDVPGLAQLVAGVGILFPVEDDKALAYHLNALIQSPAQQREMRKAGIQRARELSIENTVDCYIRMYESVLQTGALQTAEILR